MCGRVDEFLCLLKLLVVIKELGEGQVLMSNDFMSKIRPVKCNCLTLVPSLVKCKKSVFIHSIER